MTDIADLKPTAARITRLDLSAPILLATGRTALAIRAGTVIEINDRTHGFGEETPVALGELTPGNDYGVGLDRHGKPFAALLGPPNPLDEGWIAGFHYAPAGCATASSGGDTTAAINPHSLWDAGFRPACKDPRGMALVDLGARRVWVDIYLLGVNHHEHGTSRCGATISDGRDLPMQGDGSGKARKLDYATAVEIYASHGKRLLGAEEFFAAAYGVKERCSRSGEPTITGTTGDDAARFISRHGLFDVAGTMWQWGTDGHPEDPRPSLFGGSWVDGSSAGSRRARLVYWPEFSNDRFSARGASDHMAPA